MKPEIRTIYTIVEETHLDGVKALEKPTRKAACAAVFKNPYAGNIRKISVCSMSSARNSALS